MSENFDVIVLGAGIVGVSTALHLLQRGKRVALIDRRGPGEETSFGNSGIIEASSVLPYAFPDLKQLWSVLSGRDPAARTDIRHIRKVLPFVLRLWRNTSSEDRLQTSRAQRPLLAHSIAEHRALMDAAGASGFLRELGWGKLYRTAAGFDADGLSRSVLQEYGIAFEVMDPEEFTATLEPHVRRRFFKAVWLPSTATVTNPHKVTKAYCASFAARGGTVLKGDARSLATLQPGQWRVDSEKGTLTAGAVVVALGPWSTDVLRPLGYRFPLGIKRGYHRHFGASGDAVLKRSIVDIEKGYVIAPTEQGYRITTGAEFTDRDAPPNPVQIDRVLPFARELFPLTQAIDEEAWMGSRPCFPDSLPIVGPAAHHAGLWLNFGHGHLGLTLGPVTARLLAEQMTGSATLCDPEPFRSTRF